MAHTVGLDETINLEQKDNMVKALTAMAQGRGPDRCIDAASWSSQTHMQRYMAPLLSKIENGHIDASRVITHEVKLADTRTAQRTVRDKKDGCFAVVIQP